MNKQTTLFLGGSSDSPTPPLYLDGSSFVNALRSDCCLAFLIAPVPSKDGQDKEPIAVEGQPSTAVVAGNATQPPPEKKQKKKEAMATHKVVYEDIEITDLANTKHVYKIPYLVEVGCENAKSIDKPLHRETLDFDMQKAPSKAKAAKQSFALR